MFCRQKLTWLLYTAILFTGCRNENLEQLRPDTSIESGYPAHIGAIFETQCATAGCHNALSYDNAGGLLMDTWQHLLNGAGNGAVVIPFNPQNSSLLYFINTHESEGPVLQPTMPLNDTPLTIEEYRMVRDWIVAGAPNKDGHIPFSGNPETRQKIYITMQGCDMIGVVDAETRLIMRYIPIGRLPDIESPHCVKVSEDGRFAYVSFLGSPYVQKIDTRIDTVVDEAHVGSGSWNVFQLSKDGRRLLISDWKADGKMALVNTETMEVEQFFSGSGLFVYPHGVASNEDFSVFYVTAQYGNIVYKFSLDGNYKRVSIDGNPPVTNSGLRDPHEILMTPDYSRYFLTCQASNEVRVMDAVADTLIKVIPTGIKPQEMAISLTRPIIFVTCMEDKSNIVGFKGSVYAVNYETYETTRIDGPFYQPHGITVDDENGVFYVASRNSNPDGPAPHHSSSCAGRNGYYSVFDLNTFKRLPGRFEVTVEPYSADVRFKGVRN